MELLGQFMMLFPFVALFVWMAMEEGLKVAVGVFLAVAFLFSWLYVGELLTYGG